MAPEPSDPSLSVAQFGANEWLVDELYERYLADKSSVDRAWWEFFADYRPREAEHMREAAASQQQASEMHSRSSAEPPGRARRREQASARREAIPVLPSSPDLQTPVPTASADPTTAPYAPMVRGVDLSALGQSSHEEQAAAALGNDDVTAIRGPAARVVTNMDASLAVPTATSVRQIPAKALIDNRIVINAHLSRSRGGKVSFTHLIGFAVVEALADMPEMNYSFEVQETEKGPKPALRKPAHIGFGLAIDLAKSDGSRQLVVPSVKRAEEMDFTQFWLAYDEVVRKARTGKLTVDDFAGTTISLTNPGTIGTAHSVPRLMPGQGAIIGVGAMEYPAEYQGANAQTLAQMAISKVLTLTSTYDHRIIQGAQSGDFLRIIHQKLLGFDGFYDRVFASLRVPYEPARWVQDIVDPAEHLGKSARIAEMIHAYRQRGHLMADTDPLAFRVRRHPDLDMQNHGLTLWDYDRVFPTGGFGNQNTMTLREILRLLRDTYCRTVGIEYMHIHEPEQRRWMQAQIERPAAEPDKSEQLRIMRRLNAAEAFETFLQTKYVGQRRFSLEGAESIIPLLDAVMSDAAQSGMDEVTIGMAHRGRLNVLSNLAGKSYSQIFREFQGNQDPRSVQGSGDVKYHLGTEGEFTAEDGSTTKVYLAANPSHLEAVDPVLEGIARAKQDRIDLGGDGYSVLPILVHGDAAFAGQGVVAETLNLSELRGYRTGGTIHVIINNQLGFTTSPSSSRSTHYPTDVAKGFQIPIFHVNGDDPEACVHVAKLAFKYREEFNRDVIIDMVCYRRRGHNEGDDPSMTQPLMYSLIENKRSVRKTYTESLISRNALSVEEAEQTLKDYHDQLERVFTETREEAPADAHAPNTDDESVAGLELPEAQHEDAGMMVGWKTAVDADIIERIGQAQVSPPPGFTAHPKLVQLQERRQKMSVEGGIDWGYGEILAFGSLLMEGTPVRLAGQDSRRGTFVQRHAVLHDHQTGAEWTPLQYLSANQARFWVYDSSLSEYAAMGFEYGYSVERPDALVLWEAQFGDFFNGAQTIVDEFISSAEQKWGQRSSVVLLMPHGYEGQGPDHSSGRIERFLQMCAEDNMTVAFPSTPASYFHLLRRQAYKRPRRPLVVFTPKSMLRLKAAASPLDEFTTGTFREVIPDTSVDSNKVERVLMCAGKVYYDLDTRRKELEPSQADRVAIVRLEQLYPLEREELSAALAPYPNAELVWVQEEPENQGSWAYIALAMKDFTPGGEGIRVVSRAASAATASGSSKVHHRDQVELVERAFAF